MIYVTGDTHGEQGRFMESGMQKRWTEQDIVIVCGDFGYLFRNDENENRFLDELERRPYTICFVDGNHENFPAIFACPEEQWHGGRIHRIRKNIVHLMRGQVFELQGKTFFTFGGAYSRDCALRQLNVSYWQEELPTGADYREADRNLARCGYRVDYVLTHQAPQSIILRMHHFPDPHDAELTGYLDYLYLRDRAGNRVLRFNHWYCGHWHTDLDVTEDFSVLWFDVRPLECC